MDPRDYPFVRNGPDCKWCHHTRLEHVGWNERYEMRDFDLHCQVPGCENCGPCGYRPLGPLSYLVLAMHDAAEREAIMAAETKASRGMRKPLVASLWTSVLLMVLANAANHIMGWTALAAVFAAAATILFMFYAIRSAQVMRRLHESWLMTAAVLLPVPVLALATLETFVVVPAPWSWMTTFSLIGAALVLVGIDSWRSSRRYKRVMKRMEEDMGRFERFEAAGRLWQPLLVISVRAADDEPQSPG